MNDSIVVQPRKACPCGSKKITDLGFSITVEKDISRMHVCDACKLVFGIHKKPFTIMRFPVVLDESLPKNYWRIVRDKHDERYIQVRHGDSADDKSTKDND